jgi:hypothetical protein
MPNQMIALQARNPQLPNPAQRTARLANMMNMARQTEAAQRQTMQAQQAMDIEAAKEERAVALHGPALTKAQQENILQALEIFREGVADIAEGDITAAEAVRADLVARVPGWDKVLPPASSWDRNTRYGLMMKADKEIDKTISTPVSTLEVSVDGTPTSVRVGGLRPEQEPVYDRAEPTPMPASRATPTTPQAAEPANPFAPGYQPNSAAANPNSLGLVIDSALETGVMSKSDYDKLLSIAEPQIRPKIAAWAQQNNIQIMSDMPGVTDNQMRGEPVADFQTTPMAYDGQTPQSQFAVMRGEPMQSQTAGLRGAPPMEQTLAQTQPRTITKLQQRNPNVSPTPSPVPADVIGAQEGARTSASKAVELKMNPRIAAATKNAERDIEKRSEALVAKNETKTLIQSIDKYIEEIDALLRSADRRFIVGRIEGNLHYLGSLGQNERQAELQAMFDRIKNADTLGSLVAMKQATPSGGSPVGNASNQDVQLVAKGANSLTQTGGVPKFDADLKKLRRDAYRTRQNAIEFYNDRYGDLSAEDPKFKLTVRPIADRYISSKDLPKPRKTPVARKASGGFTVVRVED